MTQLPRAELGNHIEAVADKAKALLNAIEQARAMLPGIAAETSEDLLLEMCDAVRDRVVKASMDVMNTAIAIPRCYEFLPEGR